MMDCITKSKMEYSSGPGNYVFLLHDNDLTALFLGDLIDTVRAEGWEIISLPDEKGQYMKRLPMSQKFKVANILEH
jgi:hypothetical protein